MTAPLIPPAPERSTILAVWGGVTAHRGECSIWLVTDPYVDPDCFSEAIRLLGLTGRTDYEMIYDPGTGRETFIFDGTPSTA